MATEGGRGALGAPKTDVYKYAASSYTTKSNEEELFELVQLSGVPMDKELFKVILELLKLNIAPTAILQVLKTIKSKVVASDSVPSSGQQSPILSVLSPQPPNTDSHRAKTDQSAASKDQQKSTQQRRSEHKSGRSKSAKSAEKTGERSGKVSSSRQHSSASKHKTPGQSSRTQLQSRT